MQKFNLNRYNKAILALGGEKLVLKKYLQDKFPIELTYWHLPKINHIFYLV